MGPAAAYAAAGRFFLRLVQDEKRIRRGFT
jgi:hypothetical protein